ncbi:fasciclin-like arabinogalactan protein 11 [Cornus florida]|uniref:fasciclin-like arabinogalactan protein 11 n=1 Tax=Cornus florida TaxID=4283 RepID=UPI0028A25378|nr:fasciclin-like arabinogalactan protein 11 [Cornus florida]
MNNHLLFTLSLVLLLYFHSTTTLAQLPASPALPPTPPGPTNITKVLEKAGRFSILIRLLKTTQLGDRINNQIRKSDQGLTILAPTDNAFSSLKSGTINSLTDQQQVQLVQFHIIPSFFNTTLEFQTASNPMRTEAGNSSFSEFPLNVTSSGTQVNVSTGIVNATLGKRVFTDNMQLAVYQVDKVLLPMSIFATAATAPAPALAPGASKNKESSAGNTPGSDDDSPAADSGAVGLTMHGMLVSIGVGVAVFF